MPLGTRRPFSVLTGEDSLRSALRQLSALQKEIRCYDAAMLAKPAIVVVSKADLLGRAEVQQLMASLRRHARAATGRPQEWPRDASAATQEAANVSDVLAVSSETAKGVPELEGALLRLLRGSARHMLDSSVQAADQDRIPPSAA